MEWIKCSDRLPDKNKAVLALVKSACGNEKYISVLYPFDFIGKNNQKWMVADFGVGWYSHYDVTHWMPLPPLPKAPKED